MQSMKLSTAAVGGSGRRGAHPSWRAVSVLLSIHRSEDDDELSASASVMYG
jgi:hypothetical protein